MHCSIIAIALLAASATAAVVQPDATLDIQSNDLECDRDHAPNSSDCNALLDRILSGYAPHNLQSAPRSIGWGSCYVSWADYVVGNEQELVPYISRIISVCQTGQRQSGIIKNVNISGQLKRTAICLSNRPKGCKD